MFKRGSESQRAVKVFQRLLAERDKRWLSVVTDKVDEVWEELRLLRREIRLLRDREPTDAKAKRIRP